MAATHITPSPSSSRGCLSAITTVFLLYPLLGASVATERRVPDEQRLYETIMGDYQLSVMPQRNASHPLSVKFSLRLNQIVALDERQQVLTTNVFIDQMWIDTGLAWNPDNFSDVRALRIPADHVWLPDTFVYNNADGGTSGFMTGTYVQIQSNGQVLWPVPLRLRSSCSVHITYFPFDSQVCTLRFGSWIYGMSQVDYLPLDEHFTVDLSTYIKNSEWDLVEIGMSKAHTMTPTGGPGVLRRLGPHSLLTYMLHLKRNTFFYLFNIIVPCVMLSTLNVLTFWLPPVSGEKVTLGLSVFLAFSMFMLLIAEEVPATSEAVPLIGVYLCVVMTMTSLSVIMAVVVTNLYHRGRKMRAAPRWLVKACLDWLATPLCVHKDVTVIASTVDLVEHCQYDLSYRKKSQPALEANGTPGFQATMSHPCSTKPCSQTTMSHPTATAALPCFVRTCLHTDTPHPHARTPRPHSTKPCPHTETPHPRATMPQPCSTTPRPHATTPCPRSTKAMSLSSSPSCREIPATRHTPYLAPHTHHKTRITCQQEVVGCRPVRPGKEAHPHAWNRVTNGARPLRHPVTSDVTVNRLCEDVWVRRQEASPGHVQENHEADICDRGNQTAERMHISKSHRGKYNLNDNNHGAGNDVCNSHNVGNDVSDNTDTGHIIRNRYDADSDVINWQENNNDVSNKNGTSNDVKNQDINDDIIKSRCAGNDVSDCHDANNDVSDSYGAGKNVSNRYNACNDISNRLGVGNDVDNSYSVGSNSHGADNVNHKHGSVNNVSARSGAKEDDDGIEKTTPDTLSVTGLDVNGSGTHSGTEHPARGLGPYNGHPASDLGPCSGTEHPACDLDPHSGHPASDLGPNSGHPVSYLDPNSGHPASDLDPNSGHPVSDLDPNSGHPVSDLGTPCGNERPSSGPDGQPADGLGTPSGNELPSCGSDGQPADGLGTHNSTQYPDSGLGPHSDTRDRHRQTSPPGGQGPEDNAEYPEGPGAQFSTSCLDSPDLYRSTVLEGRWKYSPSGGHTNRPTSHPPSAHPGGLDPHPGTADIQAVRILVAEWQQIATVVDRLMFVLYLLFTVTAYVIILAVVPANQPSVGNVTDHVSGGASDVYPWNIQ